MKVARFEDLVAWQKARELTKQIYLMTKRESFSKDFGLREQIQRSSVSIMSNIAEGFERGSRPEFHKFIVIAKASCAEVRSHLYVAFDVGYINNEEFNSISSLAIEVSKILGGLRSSLKNKIEQ
ncbi:MAG: four helix bundle protein [Nitrospirota bacterium]